MKLNLIQMLAKVANELDSCGLYKLADKIDSIMDEGDDEEVEDGAGELDFPHSVIEAEDVKDEDFWSPAPVKRPLERVNDSSFYEYERSDEPPPDDSFDYWSPAPETKYEKQQKTLADALEHISLNPNEKYHLSSKPLEDGVLSFSQYGSGMKPRGMWYAPGNDWTRFVAREYSSAAGGYVYKLTPSDSVLKISDHESFKAFEESFGAIESMENYRYGEDEDTLESLQKLYGTLAPDWSKVAQKYAGIEISPYIREERFSRWYNSWDVASGCIWNPVGISSLTLVGYFMNGKFQPVKKKIPIKYKGSIRPSPKKLEWPEEIEWPEDVK